MQDVPLERLSTSLARRYRIERQLGRGGMATVYLAEDVKHSRRVAIKVLRPELSAVIGPQRFLREIHIAAKLTHPNILPLYDSGRAAGLLYYVMPYVEGESVRDRLDREQRLPLEDALQIAREVADALASAHNHGIGHRDIKPENILLEEGHAVVSDFGIARAVTHAGADKVTDTGLVIGTPGYMSPEQIGGTEELDGRTDVYSLGCVLYEMLAGTPPFPAATQQGVLARHMVDPVPSLCSERPEVSRAVAAVVTKALAKTPADRHATAREFAEALGKARETPDRFVSPIAEPLVTAVPNNLPNVATRFFGRENELQHLREVLAEARLVTLQGPGGCGKTRLAIELARRNLIAYPDGVWFVSLAQLTNPNLVGDSVAEALQVKPEKDRPIEHTIAHRISAKRMLVVVDNCEHLVEECARILDVLVTHTEVPQFLSTSREPMKVAGEAVFSTQPLPAPSPTSTPEEIVGCDSVLLFRDRALLNDAAYQLNEGSAECVGAICRKLDGIPLAIEMAASRVKAMGHEAVLQRLSDQLRILTSGVRTAPPRHQTLRATIDWSNDLLHEDERTLFHRLSVFAGDFDLADAEGVCGFEPLSESQVLDLLTQLLDKSLVVRVEADRAVRYALLELMKQYGREQLATKGELEKLERGYCDYYLAMARVAYKERSENVVKWLVWLQRELYNVQGALSLLGKDQSRRVELASLTGEFLVLQSRLGLAREILASALKDYPPRDAHRARALSALGWLECFYGDFDTGLAMVEEGFEIVREMDSASEKLNLYWVYGFAKTIQQEWEQARGALVEGLRLAEVAGDPWLAVRYRVFLNWISVNQLRPDVIEHDVESCLQEALARGHPFDITVSHHIYADVPLQKGDFTLSERRYIEAARSALAYQNTLQAVIEMQGVAMSVAGQGRHDKGLRLFGASMAKFEEVGAQLVKLNFWLTCIQRTIGKSMESVGPERAQLLDGEGRRMGWERALEYAFDVDRNSLPRL
jgi:non-specific serine/threonine protein kinase